MPRFCGACSFKDPEFHPHARCHLGQRITKELLELWRSEETKYPKAIEVTPSTFKTSVRNTVCNEILAAIEVNDAGQMLRGCSSARSFVGT